MKNSIYTFALLLIALPHATFVNASGSISASVILEKDSQPLADAVVTAHPISGVAEMPESKQVLIDQINKEFVREVTLIFTGDSVGFPNRDQIDHNVYSFSPAKQFELPLYKGMPEKPVLFDKPGVVTLGCNIHDWMVGYIYVSDTPYAGQTDATGSLILDNLPNGEYDVVVWHPRLKNSEEQLKQRITIKDGASTLKWSVNLKKVLRPRRAPLGMGQDY